MRGIKLKRDRDDCVIEQTIITGWKLVDCRLRLKLEQRNTLFHDNPGPFSAAVNAGPVGLRSHFDRRQIGSREINGVLIGQMEKKLRSERNANALHAFARESARSQKGRKGRRPAGIREHAREEMKDTYYISRARNSMDFR